LAAGALAQQPARALVFIGFMGAGKSRAAQALAPALGGQAIDSDAVLEERFGRSIAEVLAEQGEGWFRAREEEVVLELLGRAGPGAVIALGGGAILSERVRAALGRHLAVYLECEAQEAWERLGAARTQRPLAADRKRFAALLEERRPLYEELADATLPACAPAPRLARGAHAEGGEQELVALRALPSLVALSRAPLRTRLLWAWAPAAEYPAFVGRSLYAGRHAARGRQEAHDHRQVGAPQSAHDAALEALLPPALLQSRAFLVSDRNVAPRYAPLLGPLAAECVIEPGEEHKTLHSAERVWQAMIAAQLTRGDCVVALGGGVVGDLAGFCAATYQRGIAAVHLPTTIVAQVDSAYGGKTGIDLPAAKNYVGAYHQPAAVIADLNALSTLPERELHAGWVEVLKSALIAGGELWRAVASSAPIDERMIFDCAKLKVALVAADERDGGARQLLNLGHTVGHAIETVTGYRRFRHGEAVGLGLLVALRLSSQGALREQVRELLIARGLPVALDGVDVDALLATVRLDKKRTGEQVPFVLLHEPGRVEHGCAVSSAELRSAIGELCAEGAAERSPRSAAHGGR
jgi:shikimate kinase/3-dehydroquinate synthase